MHPFLIVMINLLYLLRPFVPFMQHCFLCNDLLLHLETHINVWFSTINHPQSTIFNIIHACGNAFQKWIYFISLTRRHWAPDPYIIYRNAINVMYQQVISEYSLIPDLIDLRLREIQHLYRETLWHPLQWVFYLCHSTVGGFTLTVTKFLSSLFWPRIPRRDLLYWMDIFSWIQRYVDKWTMLDGSVSHSGR